MKQFAICLLLLGSLTASAQKASKTPPPTKDKKVVYQIFTRLYGNDQEANVPWGTKEQNGVGKFNDIDDHALANMKAIGVTHVWYTGVLHHALIADYKSIGISDDDPDVVKGRAGSPYAVKDYYQVNPDLAVNPAKRMQEFEALIKRTQKAGLKTIIDIVPNHVARKYEGKNNPKGVVDFGAKDDKSVEYHKNNNFYYLPGQAFQVPDFGSNLPLGGNAHPLADGKFMEIPAKWTGNGSRLAQPNAHDWYETVKVNYGVDPDGMKDFPELPLEYGELGYQEHFKFWQSQEKELPDSWKKFRDIALFWIDKGVDGFRYDMAEMVPFEFWSYLNSNIKMKNPNAFLLAEIYNPKIYRDYIDFGKMDYLYDKVGLYDTLKYVIQRKSPIAAIAAIQATKKDIEHNMLHFLENHDEQRLASKDFVTNPHRAKPLAVISAAISSSPMMLYFGQEVGEPGNENAGYGQATRTSIFDYIGVPTWQRYRNKGSFDGARLSREERELRDFYLRLLNFVKTAPAILGEYAELHTANDGISKGYQDVFAFTRWSDKQKLLVVSNFSDSRVAQFELLIPKEILEQMGMDNPNGYVLKDQVGSKSTIKLNIIKGGAGKAIVTLSPSESFIYEMK